MITIIGRIPHGTRWLSVVVSIVLSLVLISPSPALVAGANDSDSGQHTVDSVSGRRMMETIQRLQEFGSRAFYLESANESAEYIYERFSNLGMEVDYQELMAGSHSVRNVIATLPGTSSSEGILLFGAHYDSENRDANSINEGVNVSAPGADDDASGISAVLELATVLSGQELTNTIKFAAFAAEEAGYDESGGLEGSSQFVMSEMARDASYSGSVILDMIGYPGENGSHVLAVVNSNEWGLANVVSDSVSKYDLELRVDIVLNSAVTNSDHYPFWVAGYPSVLLIEELDSAHGSPINPYYHSANDTWDKLSESQMENTTKALAGAVMQVAQPQEEENSEWLVGLGLVLLGATIITGFYIRRRRKGKE